jgi:hypothetical protein
MDEFAQFLNASIHPPNELSVPRCYPDPAPYQRSLLVAPMTAPNSRRSSASSRGAFIGNGSRSLSLGYQQVNLNLGDQMGEFLVIFHICSPTVLSTSSSVKSYVLCKLMKKKLLVHPFRGRGM